MAFLELWYKAFPHAHVCMGNHDLRLAKRAFKSGVSKRCLRDYGEVIGSPGWVFVDEIIINKVLYCHGSTEILISVVNRKGCQWYKVITTRQQGLNTMLPGVELSSVVKLVVVSMTMPWRLPMQSKTPRNQSWRPLLS